MATVTRLAEHHARLHEAVALRTNLHSRAGFPPEGQISLDEYGSIPMTIPLDPHVHDGGGGGGGGGTTTIMDRIFVRTPEFQQKNGAWRWDVVCRFCRNLVAVFSAFWHASNRNPRAVRRPPASSHDGVSRRSMA